MSGEESSSIKQCHRCAVGLPAPSGDCGKRMEVHFEFSVYGLILYLAFYFREGRKMYQALYRKWRPAVFEDVVGQDHITSVLKSEVQAGKISHAYLFCGPRGTGKTTCAKIIAKAANCLSPVNGDPCGKCAACRSIDSGNCTDVIEMDAASNNGVDDIRDIRDAVVYTPAELKYRVYIIDEVHMLSISAFNALLKTLEEPPEHVLFILATTELHKIPATVLSRCQRFDFHRVSPDDMVRRMEKVCAGEGIEAEAEALKLIAGLSQGAVRDALNMLEYCSGTGGRITLESASSMLGAASSKLLGEICTAISSGDAARALEITDKIYNSSRDIAVFWRELIAFYRDMLVYISSRGKVGADRPAAEYAEHYDAGTLFRILDIFITTESNMQKIPASAKIYAEMALIRACEPESAAPAQEVAYVQRAVPKPRAETARAASASSASPATPAAEAPRAESPLTSETVANAPTAEKSADDKPAETAKESASGKIPMRRWGDVVKRIVASDMALGSFIRGSAALECDGCLYVVFDKPFGISLMNDKRKGDVSSAIKEATGKDFPPEKILCLEQEKAENLLGEPMEELIKKFEEFGKEK